MTKFQNKYRIESARLKEWDYANPWWYYVTINTKNHINYFGEVVKGEMQLNTAGKIVVEEWLKSKVLRKNVDLDYYIIMPNHLHGIIIIDVETTGSVVSKNIAQNTETTQRVVSTTLQRNSLGSIIGQFKSVCTKRINSICNNNFAWQSRFYDRIIRNEKELFNIRKYIDQNPLKWDLEKESAENIFDI